jgi:hypothetical protein
MESSPGSRAGEIASHLSMILVSVASLVFFAFFHEYIAWYTTAPDGSITRLSILTDDYFRWLPIPTVAAILAILAYAIMIFYDADWYQMAAPMLLSVVGIVVDVSLLSIFPFDFSVIPSATAAEVLPKVITGFFIFLASVYGISAIVMFVRLMGHKKAR